MGNDNDASTCQVGGYKNCTSDPLMSVDNNDDDSDLEEDDDLNFPDPDYKEEESDKEPEMTEEEKNRMNRLEKIFLDKLIFVGENPMSKNDKRNTTVLIGTPNEIMKSILEIF